MNNSPTIYPCLGSAFWIQRKCQTCQQFFTKSDYESKNCQLAFQEVLTVDQSAPKSYACLEVIVVLTHQLCPLTCGFAYQTSIYQNVQKT